MLFVTIDETASKWGISLRQVRAYCAKGRIPGAMLDHGEWRIPENAAKPERKPRRTFPTTVLGILEAERSSRISGGLYHRLQIDLAYNSNHIEGSRLTHEQTRFIFETNTIGITDQSINVDDIVETTNHFRCIDLIIDRADEKLSEPFIKVIHRMLKTGTSDSGKSWSNEVGGNATCPPEEVHARMKALLSDYNTKSVKTLEDIIDLHQKFESIHPFQDGNGRVGRLIMFKECLANGIVPFIITDELKMFYYRGLSEWGHINGYLTDTCLSAQDNYKALLDYFKIKY